MKLYKDYPDLHRHYKDGSRAKDLGAAITTNPFPVATEQYWAWFDGWNKTQVSTTPRRATMNFDIGITAVDPGTGEVAFNTAVFTTVTNIKLNFTTQEGSNIYSAIDAFTVGLAITLYSKADPTNFASYTINSQTLTTFATLAVTYVNSAGSLFTTGMPLTVQVG